MLTNEEMHRLDANDHARARQPGLIGRIAAAVIGALMLVGAFMVSVVVLAFAATAAVAGGFYLWWRTRALRRQLRERMRNQPTPGGRIIDGEVIRDIEPGRRY